MDQWLDSLSEDWVSQPRSPHSDQLRRSSSALSVTSTASNVSQSRIPRLKPRTTTNRAVDGPVSSKRISSASLDSNHQRILKERSSSNLNVSQNRAPEIAAHSPGGEKRSRSKQHATTTSVLSIPQDTIQRRTSRVSPAKENHFESTPDWKRRLVQGKTGGAGTDLFGPIGLENIFKPPTVGRAYKPGEKQQCGKKYHPMVVEQFPSSPPAFPSELGSVERSGGTDRRRSSLLKQMDILEEVSEGESRYSLPRATDRASEKEDRLEKTASRKVSESITAERDDNEVLSQVVLPKGLIQEASPHLKKSISRSSEKADHSRVTRKEGSPQHQEGSARSANTASPSPLVEKPQLASDWTSHSLPDDLSTGTDLYAANGAFVNIRRGGYSNEGSFNNRLLSPSSLPDFDAPELRSPSPTHRLSTRGRKSKAPGELEDQSGSAPTTPLRKQHGKSNSAEELHSSGSPLKLFDKYDTFTNDRLIRRISRYENSMQESEEEPIWDDRRHQDSNQALVAGLKLNDPDSEEEEVRFPPSDRRISSFGEGQLDNFPFHASHPLESESRSAPTDRKASDGSNYQGDIFRSQEITVKSYGMTDMNIQVDAKQLTTGKRLAHSPSKGSQAKRRCTLHNSGETRLEIHQYAEPTEGPTAIHAKPRQESEVQSQIAGLTSLESRSVAGKKRKDARYDNESPAIDPKVLALRRILRPRTPTPSQRGPSKPFADGVDPALQEMPDADLTDEMPIRDLDHQTQALAGELATFTLNMAQDMSGGGRKASVTTADFFNEAKQIMQLIRNQARPQSSHGILEENENEDLEEVKPPVDESTIDELSRPPSREGGSLRRFREPAPVDARVVSHLRKFEDTDDLGLALPSSVKTMHIKESLDPSMSPEKSEPEDTRHQSPRIQSDPPNIRIRAQAGRHVQRDDVRSEAIHTTTSTETQSYRSQSSSGPSSGRSVPTGSSQGSRSSGTKAVIAPQVVSHLLSDNVGGMTFDHKKQVWIKRKISRGSQGLDTHSRSGSDITENLFEDIPDLSIDESREQQCTQRVVTSIKALTSGSDRISTHDHVEAQQLNGQYSRPQTRGSATTGTADESSASSKYASNGPVPETRASSGSDGVIERQSVSIHVQRGNGNHMPQDEGHSEEVEHEISILEGRTSESPRRLRQGQQQPRVVTVAFSSPLVNQVQTVGENDAADPWDDGSDLDLADSPSRDNARSSSTRKRRESLEFGKRSVYRSGSRRVSIGLARPMSRVDENEELAFLQSIRSPRNTSMNLVLTTPLPAARSMLQPPALSSAQSSSIGFQLSPLSEFTVNNNDELANQSVNHIVRHRGFLAAHEVEGKFSLADQEIVKKLTDIEPYEPYWDHIRLMDLHGKGLQSLHMLDQYCGHLEDLNVSDNVLSQLHGAPSSIRHLRVRHNCLSSLTSWSHHQNLQYLDVSSNQISSLMGFRSLVHLRELKAAHNQIQSLEGIMELDGLLKLMLSGNCIKSVSFETSNLIRLTDLDLRQNQLVEVVHLDHLPNLKHLDLSENVLEVLDLQQGSRTLQDLRLGNNHLDALDIGQLPSLQFLDVDKNSITNVNNLASHASLRILSWREQYPKSDSTGVDLHYQQCRNVKELYLSGNTLRTFVPSIHLLDLRHLELASTGLQHLPEDFGIKCSNLRSLNLNFNALTELRPLLGLVKLEKLHLAGNRISRLRRTASVLDQIGHELVEIDFRQNPLTMGFYMPQCQKQYGNDQQLIVSREQCNSQEVDGEVFKAYKECMIYIVRWVDQGVDDAARQRLDEDTKLRRRVYEMLIALRCTKLTRLDGLCLDRRKVAIKDGVWERLMELGVLTSKEQGDAIELEG
ncbi:MAG: hypothetical protein Q9209_004562 [Squamulea sp. 1 TL-2023]